MTDSLENAKNALLNKSIESIHDDKFAYKFVVSNHDHWLTDAEAGVEAVSYPCAETKRELDIYYERESRFTQLFDDLFRVFGDCCYEVFDDTFSKAQFSKITDQAIFKNKFINGLREINECCFYVHKLGLFVFTNYDLTLVCYSYVNDLQDSFKSIVERNDLFINK